MNNLTNILQQLDLLLTRKELVLVAIDGKSGAGKSSLASKLRKIYDCNIFQMDHFFLTPQLRTAERLREVGGNVDYLRFRAEVMDRIKSGCEFSYCRYDCQADMFGLPIKVHPKRLNIIEGVYCLHPTLIDNYHLKIFMDISAAEQEKRILHRNGPLMLERFVGEWIPLENCYFEKMMIKEQCDIVLDGFSFTKSKR